MEEAEPLLNRALILAGVHSARNIRKCIMATIQLAELCGLPGRTAMRRCRCAKSVDLTSSRSSASTVPATWSRSTSPSVCQGQLIVECAELAVQ